MKRNSVSSIVSGNLAILLFLIVGVTFGQSKRPPAESTRIQKTVEDFYKIRERTLDERGSEKDVLELLDLMADNIVYEHPVANAKLTREQVRGGMMAHLKEGKNAVITLHNIKEGKNFVIVEMTLQYEVEGKSIKRRGVSIFEFANGKIQRIAEY